MKRYILAIDQGTTSSRAVIFDRDQRVVASAQQEFRQYFPQPGWVEHDAEDIWKSVLSVCRQVIAASGAEPDQIAAIGITNQRETTLMWDRKTGKTLHRAIVWQDRRTADLCKALKKAGHEKTFTRKTGLLLDPYFSGTKIAWMLDNVKGLRKKAENGDVAFGTVDTYLVWRLSGGRQHVTDATNASRTLLLNIATGKWDTKLLEILGVPAAILPKVLDCADDFGVTQKRLFGAEVPILGIAGDQQAATIGNACFEPGMMKSTYGTGCFALLNTGADKVASKNRLLTTIAYRLDGESTYALEGSIFMAGATVQWLRDGLEILKAAERSGEMAAKADPQQDVYLVPAFTGLGAPYWDAQARGALFGLTRGTGRNEIARAALEAVCFQTYDLLSAMRGDWKGDAGKTVLRVDGGMAASDWTMQALADILDAPVDRPKNMETTVLGAAWLAGSRAGIWPGRSEFTRRWARDRRFKPKMKPAERRRKLDGWADAVRRTLSGPQGRG
jgi:glycerol kinase